MYRAARHLLLAITSAIGVAVKNYGDTKMTPMTAMSAVSAMTAMTQNQKIVAGDAGDTAAQVSAVNPQLQPPANNGGPTPTTALGPGSAALDAGDPAGCDSPAGGLLLADQRGLFRHADGNGDGLARCDIGAFEVVPQLFLALLRR